jgi:hypothetical protein
MKKLKAAMLAAAFTTTLAYPAVSKAGITVLEDGDKFLAFGGTIQVQYHLTDEDTDSPDDVTTDELFFRRFRPYIEGSLHKDWKGKFEIDFGKAVDTNEVSVKDAFMEYTGFKNDSAQLVIKIGNTHTPFSREVLTSSKTQQLVERTFVGDHDYGTPERNLGVHVTGALLDKKLTFGVSGASASIDPDSKKLDFDSPVNRDTDFNQGWLVGGRVDVHPLGNLKFSQADFDRKIKFTAGAAAFAWQNDDDNNTYTSAVTGLDTSAGKKPDVESVSGFEASAGVRGYGVSIDGQYNRFNADTVDSTVTAGIFKDGETTLENWAVEGGVMVWPGYVEIVGGYEEQDADNYMVPWKRASGGVNFYIKKHDVKLQTTYSVNRNVNGVEDEDLNEFYAQAQYVF